MHQIGYGADDVIKTHTTGANEFTSCSHEIHRMIRRQHNAAFESPRIDRVNEEKHILITTQLVHTTCNSKVSKQHEIVSLTLADDKMAGGCNPESVKSKKKLL